MEHFGTHPVGGAGLAVPAPPEPRGVASGGRYFHYTVPLVSDRPALLKEWRRMGQASAAQDRIRDNGFLRDHEE